MTENIARQPKGVPAGGQFAATSHAEPDLNLVATRRPELDGWPESLPDPEVTVGFGDSNSIVTTVNINGEPAFEVWNRDDDVHDTETSVFVVDGMEDDDVAEAAEKWATDKHNQIAPTLRAEMRAAADRIRAQVLAKATGKRVEATTAELEDFRSKSAEAANQARKDLELSSAALAARDILADHPNAAFAELRIDSWDNGDFVSGAVVSDDSGVRLYEYAETGGADDREERDNLVVDTPKSLNANAADSHWAGAFSTGSYDDGLFTIDFRRAAAWTPGDEL